MNPAIAIVGMACRYGDARSPRELWENALAQRQAFRRMPNERVNLADYFHDDPSAPDRTYATEAALIEGYTFDRVRFRVAGRTFRSTDMAHWLALDVAASALADAGFPEGAGLPRETTGVLFGNTLTGEFSRANLMRLRWPYVRRQVGAALADLGMPAEQRTPFLVALEQRYKAPFPEVTEDTLAGGLANTIAGRICNHFDLHGGGYTVDGACASSLLAVATLCGALVAGDLDVGIAGGVDLSLDPFELVGFAKTGALAREKMRVYDERSAGFWAGEGCGAVVLMRLEDAQAQGRTVYACIRGWGVSSDGSGGMTRPEVEGQLLALRRAYRRAGFGADTVGYFEGHGTGTGVGDATELRVLARARREAAGGAHAQPAAVGSIKANIGHTKAAAGIAGLIKAALAVSSGVIPPISGCEVPHHELAGAADQLRVVRRAEAWAGGQPRRAGVSAMGFGGINAHVILESHSENSSDAVATDWFPAAQDGELFLLGAADLAALLAQVRQVLALAPQLARAELTDLAAALARDAGAGPARAALVATTPAELAAGLDQIRAWLEGGLDYAVDARAGLFLGQHSAPPRIGLLFPGQGAPSHVGGGALHERFAHVRAIYRRAALPQGGDGRATDIAQPAIVAASVAAFRTLERCGVHAQVGLGHSLGELTALHWAESLSEDAVLGLAQVRGRAMADLGDPTGKMASIAAGRHEVERLFQGEAVSLACVNSPRQTVIAGAAMAIDAVVSRAKLRGIAATPLAVSHAFHSPLVGAAAAPLAQYIQGIQMRRPSRAVASTITGQLLPPDADIPALLVDQVTAPVRFVDAAQAADAMVDLWIEAGPGRILSGLAGEFLHAPAVSMDAGGDSLLGLLRAVGAAYAFGAPVDAALLFDDRLCRPFSLDWQPSFLASPCEQAPLSDADLPGSAVVDVPHEEPLAASSVDLPLDVICQIIAERAEIPIAALHPSDHLLADLHLNSIAVGQIIAEAARRLQRAPPAAPSMFANATVAEAAEALGQLGSATAAPAHEAAGVDSWVRAFHVRLVERAPAAHPADHGDGPWQIYAPEGHPLAAPLRAALAGGAGSGVLVALPATQDERSAALLLAGAQAALRAGHGGCFVVVQQGGGGAALARTLHLEHPQVRTCVVDLPFDHPLAAAWVAHEARAAIGYTEVHYDSAGRRYQPQMEVLEPIGEHQARLSPDDVLLVSGGGKGITAECALAIAREHGVRLALLGRALPSEDAELAANLARMRRLGVAVAYASADVTDADAVRRAVADLAAQLGPITGLIHGAARNQPRLLSALSDDELRSTLAPKVQGLENMLAAVDPAKIRTLIGFSSIIARMGLPGEADYALANEWMSHRIAQFQADNPQSFCLTVEWSVWADVGMGARLGSAERLSGMGIVPIPVDQGIAMLLRLLRGSVPGCVVVAGRYGDLPTLVAARPDLPLLRFLERALVYYPGVELVAEADLSVDTDPYLDEHVFRGERIFPAVMGLEAMVQVASALHGSPCGVQLESVSFSRPITADAAGQRTIRIAALLHEPGVVAVAIRSEESLFQVDHFRAVLRFGPITQPESASVPLGELPLIALDPQRDLYGGLLFHQGRFQRLRGYRRLSSTGCVAQIAGPGALPWFSQYLPQLLLLGDAGVRDTAIHAIQACVPHLTLLPVSIEQLAIFPSDAAGPGVLSAHERCREGDMFTYDLELRGPDGALRERWVGLRLRVVGGAGFQGAWPEPLLAPYFERLLHEQRLDIAGVALVCGGTRAERAERAAAQSAGAPLLVWHRPDGAPEIDTGRISFAHTDGLTMAVLGEGLIACDIEPVVSRSAVIWADLLGAERLALADLLARESGWDRDSAATAVWAAYECLVKAARSAATPLLLASCAADSACFHAGDDCGVVVLRAACRSISQLVLAALGMRPRNHEPIYEPPPLVAFPQREVA